MLIFILKNLFARKTARIVFISFCFLSASLFANAQMRDYNLIYSENLKGGTTIFGNTLLSIKNISAEGVELDVDTAAVNSNRADGNSAWGNDFQYMGNIDIDGNSGFGSVTRNSSSADLILPQGTNTIKLARLYWGGRVKNSDFDLTLPENKKVKIRKGTSLAYSDVTALGIDRAEIVEGYTEYQAYADITSYVKNSGSGTYCVGNVPLSTGIIDNGGNNGGWCIVVVYENPSVNYNSIRVFDGFTKVFDGGNSVTATITLSGLDVPSGALTPDDAKMGVMAWEGDANLYGDFLKINGIYFSNETNQFYNPWNGTITDNGVHVSTKNPNYTNQMGIDIDMFNVGNYGIEPNAKTVNLEFGTEADQYYPGLFTFSIKMKDPTITLEKSVEDANKNHLAEVNEILTYTLKGKNTGVGNANEITLIDTLPNTVTYLPNSLKVISSPGISAGSKTDAANDDIAEYISDGSVKSVVFRIGTGATAATGGTLGENETYEVQFQVKVNDPGAGAHVPSIMNIARVKSTSDANIIFVDDGTAIINAEEGPLPVILEKFAAILLQNNSVKLDWSTSMEINCKEFLVERSEDGIVFSPQMTVAGSGTTSLVHNYSAIDEIPSSAGNIIYYRLKQIDLDGKFHLSKVLAVKLKKENIARILPNPFTSYLNINLIWQKTETITLRIINVSGKKVFSKNISVKKGTNYINIDDLSKFPSGSYFIQFISSTERITQKISK
jgi:uncharacterized repeat protein (TIGR01451 family)